MYLPVPSQPDCLSAWREAVRLVDAELEVGVVELVVAHAQAVARLPGVYRIGAVGEGVAHGFQRAGRRQQLGAVGGAHGAELAGVSKARHFTALARRLRVVFDGCRT